MNTPNKAVTGEGNAPRESEIRTALKSYLNPDFNVKLDKHLAGARNAERGPSGKITIEFESVSGASLQKRFNTLKRYYSPMLGENTGDWVASQIKESLIRNLQNGLIVVKVNNQNVGIA